MKTEGGKMKLTIWVNEYKIKIVQGSNSEKTIFRNLMQLYQYDASEYNGDTPDPHGLFDYAYLDHYWTVQGKEEEGRIAFLIKVNDELAGFILINNYSSFIERGKNTHSLAEFFIMRKWRRLGIGKTVAHEVFRNFPGQWEVKQERANKAAIQFWKVVINEFTQGNFKTFDSTPPKRDGFIQVFTV